MPMYWSLNRLSVKVMNGQIFLQLETNDNYHVVQMRPPGAHEVAAMLKWAEDKASNETPCEYCGNGQTTHVPNNEPEIVAGRQDPRLK